MYGGSVEEGEAITGAFCYHDDFQWPHQTQIDPIYCWVIGKERGKLEEKQGC